MSKSVLGERLMNKLMVEDELSLFEDVVKSLRWNSEYGAWVPAQRIGLECGFDLSVAARNVQKHLKNLVDMGLAEDERSQKPIVYRWKEWKKIYG